MRIVSKFGGTSLATPESILEVVSILRSNADRRAAVVSAPGISPLHREKVTDMLLRNHVEGVRARFHALMSDLTLHNGDFRYLERAAEWAAQTAHEEERVSFGEHMMAYVLARVLDWHFVDARGVFHLRRGACEKVAILWNPDVERVVVPGFYGISADTGQIALFPRGGSDISGAHLAVALDASLYENWTDVDGIWSHNPKTSPDARHIDVLSYRDMERLARGGAQVLHPDTLAPVRSARIPVLVRNTFNPDGPRTLIVGSPLA